VHLQARLAMPHTPHLRATLAHLAARLAAPRTQALRASLGHLQARLHAPDTVQLRRGVTHLRARLPAPRTASLRINLGHMQARLAPPDTAPLRDALQAMKLRTEAHFEATQRARRQALAALNAQLELLNPQRTLERGYAIVTGPDGRAVRSPDALHAGARLHVRVAEGGADVTLAEARPDAGEDAPR
ncbi:MAG TPA: exodeoxyribonuclease VII large subunit, partial [Burkholderiaceae bacterium]